MSVNRQRRRILKFVIAAPVVAAIPWYIEKPIEMFFIGANGHFSIGSASGSRVVWDGENLEIVGKFIPTLTGFC